MVELHCLAQTNRKKIPGSVAAGAEVSRFVMSGPRWCARVSSHTGGCTSGLLMCLCRSQKWFPWCQILLPYRGPSLPSNPHHQSFRQPPRCTAPSLPPLDLNESTLELTDKVEWYVRHGCCFTPNVAALCSGVTVSCKQSRLCRTLG